MLQQTKPLSNSSLSFHLRKKNCWISKSFEIFSLSIFPCIAMSQHSFRNKKSRTNARQIWKIFRDKINLSDLRKGTLKKMQWEAT